MPVRESYAHGTPSWCDVSSRDLEGSKAFYGAIFGWEMRTAPEPEAGGYTMAVLEGRSAAAVTPQPQEQIDMGIPPHWTMYFTVDDVDAMPAKIEAAGGSVMARPFDVMTAGRMMVATDPEGAVFCLWQAGENIGAEIVNQPGALTWSELYTADHEQAAAFYGDALGMATRMSESGTSAALAIFGVGDTELASVLPIMGPEGTPPHWLPYFGVEDCAATLARINELGGQVHMGPMDIDQGRIAVVADPEGAAFALIELAPGLGA
ncbi:MAG: VOC family protein [Actinomycetota bacterium]